MKILFVLSSLLFFVGCGKFEFPQFLKSSKKNHRAQTENANKNADKAIFIHEESDSSSYTENLIKNAKKALTTKSCTKYDSGTELGILGAFTNAIGVQNPARDVKNCIAYAVDMSLKPICDHEIELENLRKNHLEDELALNEIDEALDIAKNAKQLLTNELYELSDAVDAERDKILNDTDNKNSNIGKDLLRLIADVEFSSFASFFENRAKETCLGFKQR